MTNPRPDAPTQDAQPGVRFSLVIPSYNRADLLGETLNAARAQTRPFDEIVVVDDGSTDHTLQLLRHWPGVRVLHTENCGVQAARNIGIAASSGDWIVLCDSDDLLAADYLARLEQTLSAHPQLEAVFVNFCNFNDNSRSPDKLQAAPPDWLSAFDRQGDVALAPPDLYRQLLLFQPCFPSGMAVRRDVHERIGGYDPAMRGIGAEDWEYTLRLALGARVALLLPVLASIRRHAGNHSRFALRQTLGELHILQHSLQHSLQHHTGASAYAAEVRQQLHRRSRMAFDDAYAAGDFPTARDIANAYGVLPHNLKQLTKHLILRLPVAWRGGAWQATLKRPGNLPALPPRISIIEPAWDGHTHLPNNVGLLQTAALAWPNARLQYVGGAAQIAQLRQIAPSWLMGRTVCYAWDVAQDSTPQLGAVNRAIDRWCGLPRVCTEGAALIILTSVTPTALHACSRLRLARKTIGMLHGNATEVDGWRSRNPVTRWFDLTSSLQRFLRDGGHAAVLEPRIVQGMQARHPWMRDRVLMLPHPLVADEARTPDSVQGPGTPVRIGFAGLATAAKGFKQFIALAEALHAQAPGRYSFHAFGKLHKSLLGIDQSALQDPAGDPLGREAFVTGLRSVDFLFLWHDEQYYQQAASGVFYDCVNQLLPLISRRTDELAGIEASGLKLGLLFEKLDEAVARLRDIDRESLLAAAKRGSQSMAAYRRTLDFPVLAENLRRQVEEAGIGNLERRPAAEEASARTLW